LKDKTSALLRLPGTPYQANAAVHQEFRQPVFTLTGSTAAYLKQHIVSTMAGTPDSSESNSEGRTPPRKLNTIPIETSMVVLTLTVGSKDGEAPASATGKPSIPACLLDFSLNQIQVLRLRLLPRPLRMQVSLNPRFGLILV